MSEALQVVLPPDASEQLRLQLVALLNSSVEEVKKASAGQASEWLKGKTGVAAYLSISTATVTKMINQGLPEHYIEAAPSLTFFSKAEVNSFILNDGVAN